MSTFQSSLELSIVIPLKDEEDNVQRLYGELIAALTPLNKSFEIIFVNDGSTDKTEALLTAFAQEDLRLRLITFRRNFGQTAAMSAGFKAAKGRVVIAMDGDLQNDPRDIGLLLNKIDEGYDVVSGWRKNRKDKTLSRKVPSKIANWLIGKTVGVKLHDYGCSLKAYRRSMLTHIDLYGEMHRFIPAHAAQVGARICEIPVNHRAREAGKTKYNITRTFRVILDILTVKFLMQFATRPMHFVGLPGLASSSLGLLIVAYLALTKLIWGASLAERPLLLIGVLLILAGAQFFSFGLLAEMLVRTHYASSGKLTYIIRSEVVNGKLIEST